MVEAKVDDAAVFSDAKSAARDERSGYLVVKNTQRKAKHWGNRNVKTKGTPEADAKKKADKGEVGNYGPTGLGASYNPEGQQISENPLDTEIPIGTPNVRRNYGRKFSIPLPGILRNVNVNLPGSHGGDGATTAATNTTVGLTPTGKENVSNANAPGNNTIFYQSRDGFQNVYHVTSSKGNSGNHTPLVIFKRNRSKTYAVLEFDRLLELLNESK